MRTQILFKFATAALLSAAACAKPAAPPAAAAGPEYRTTSTIRDIMQSEIAPSADVLWNAVSSNVTAKGIEEKAPKTDEEWKAVRAQAILLQEATNLIVMPGRHVAAAGEKPQDAKVQLTPEQIEVLINQDRETWRKMAFGLHDALVPALNAIDARDAMKLSDAGDGIDKACESCHEKYWYPKEAAK